MSDANMILLVSMKKRLITIKKDGEPITLTPKEAGEAVEAFLLYLANGAVDIICDSHGYDISDHDKEIIANKAEYCVFVSIMADVKKRVESILEMYE